MCKAALSKLVVTQGNTVQCTLGLLLPLPVSFVICPVLRLNIRPALTLNSVYDVQFPFFKFVGRLDQCPDRHCVEEYGFLACGELWV